MEHGYWGMLWKHVWRRCRMPKCLTTLLILFLTTFAARFAFAAEPKILLEASAIHQLAYDDLLPVTTSAADLPETTHAEPATLTAIPQATLEAAETTTTAGGAETLFTLDAKLANTTASMTTITLTTTMQTTMTSTAIPSTTTRTSTTTTAMQASKAKEATMASITDTERFVAWSQYTQYSGKGRPRILMFTWCTNNSYWSYRNENYWKLCYAKVHGFDVLFTDDTEDVNGVKKWKETLGWGEKFYSDRFMWAWLFAVRRIMLSGDYDYVFVTGADVLIHEPNLQFPLWALDTGHDLTVMDQHLYSFGLNSNALLFKVSKWSVQFLDDMLSHRGDFNIQGENGPYMEAILSGLGRELDADGKPGYRQACTPLMKLEKSAAYLFHVNHNNYARINEAYSRCFFTELDRMAGPYGNRQSKHIGFSPTFGPNMLPWANCWSLVRDYWKDWYKNCLTLHWNGQKMPGYYHPVKGQCPDLGFDWGASIYNPDNREKPVEMKSAQSMPFGSIHAASKFYRDTVDYFIKFRWNGVAVPGMPTEKEFLHVAGYGEKEIEGFLSKANDA